MSSPATPAAPAAAPTQFLSFVLAGEEYALDILCVREIIAYDTLTRVPGMPECVRGMINLRGRVVPVVDLALRFGLPASEITPRTCIVVVERSSPDGELVVGIITDAVSEVLDLDADRIQPTPGFGTSVGAEFLNGLAEKSERSSKFVMLLNIDRALDRSAFAHSDAR
jgi:purine-binding chemotaxis protein CheW